MKKHILTVVVAIFGITIMTAQSNCSVYYPLEEGSTFQYTMYDKKGKADGVTDYSISNVTDSGGETRATFNMKFSDNKGKELLASEYDIICTGEGIEIDYMSIMPSQMMSQYEEMGLDMDISGTNIEVPNNLSLGQDLNDANVAVNMEMSGISMNITVDMTNRKVKSKETLTTPAGSFDCYVLSQTIITKVMGKNLETNSKQWLAEGVGMIKQESYKKNGSLENSTELTKISK